jgi:murein DD-endopeptidase MepM/ murein hydrolase activator NlpD
MKTEQPPREVLRPLRPLPSIDIPLLREERSAVRNRRLVRLAIAGSMLAAVGTGAAWLGRSFSQKRAASLDASDAPALIDESAQANLRDVALSAHAPGTSPAPNVRAPSAPPPAAAEPGPAPRMAGRHERTFGRADSFQDALTRAGLSVLEATSVITALSGKLDFRRAHAEDLLIIERDAEARLERFEYRSAPTVRYEATRTEAGTFVGREMQLPIETVRLARGGFVTASLGDALEGLKLGRALTGVFSDVFAGKVNFSTDTRAGDSFRVLLDEERIDGEFLRYGTILALEYRGEKVGVLRAFWHESKQTEGDFFDPKGRALQGGWLRTPLRYDHISSGFGVRFHPVLRRKLAHNGIDYAASPGTTVRAAAAGTIRVVGARGANGNLIAITHPHGYETFYAHLSRFAPGIKAGVRVKQRQPIAYVGSTGRSTGPHLHFALKRGGGFVDPGTQLNGPGLPLSTRELPEYVRRVQSLSSELERIPLERPEPIVAAPVPTPGAPLDFGDEEL